MKKIMILMMMASALMLSACDESTISTSESNPIINNIENSGAGNVYLVNGDGDITECYSTGADGKACTEEHIVDAVFIPETE